MEEFSADFPVIPVCFMSGNNFFFLNYTKCSVCNLIISNFLNNFAIIRKKLPFSGRPPFSSIDFVHKHVHLLTNVFQESLPTIPCTRNCDKAYDPIPLRCSHCSYLKKCFHLGENSNWKQNLQVAIQQKGKFMYDITAPYCDETLTDKLYDK